MHTAPKTRFFTARDADRKWYVADVNGKNLGRAASTIAKVLRGKHKPTFTPNTDQGDFVIVINADKINVASKREELKTYFRYSGYPGGVKLESLKDLMTRKPEWVVENAIKGMLPKTKLGKKLARKLKVYRGTEHPHTAQRPESLKLD